MDNKNKIMERLNVELVFTPNQSKLKKGDKGFIHAYVRGVDEIPYAVVVGNEIIDMTPIHALKVVKGMATKNQLIEKYEKELQEILAVFDVDTIKEIPERPYKWRASAINSFLVDLKQLP